MAKMRIAVLFGGVSSEHEISCISAAAVANNLDAEKYEVLKIGITKKGRWLMFPGCTSMMADGSWETFEDNVPAILSPDRATRGLITHHGNSIDTIKLDMVFPVLHGRNGEDGTIQGLLELGGIPYVGCGVLSSAMCMDKAAANLVFDATGIPHTPWMCIHRSETENFDKVLFQLKDKLNFPLFVKPAIGGSSVGVTKVKTEAELHSAIQLASAHDEKIMLEQAVDGCEVECAVLGTAQPFATLPGEVESCNEVYDYEAKYQSGDASQTYLPARLPQPKLEEVRGLALKAYKALGCSGLARVDFFVERGTGRVLISEINTMPGFTPISMYAKLMAHNGIDFSALLDRLVLYALERAEA